MVDHFFILKAQQQRHERDLALLKLKAEQEALECQRQLEETRSKAAQVTYFAKFLSLKSLQYSFHNVIVKRKHVNNSILVCMI